MNRIKELRIFFVITFFITWALWLPSVLKALGISVPIGFLIISMMASFTPSIVGLILHRRFLGTELFKIDMRERLTFYFKKRWLIGILILFFGTSTVSYFLMRLFVRNFVPVNTMPWYMAPLVFIQILLIGGALGEEFGWRGFVLPRLLKITRPMYASLILGVLWSIWHLPLFFMEGTVQSNMPIWQFMIQNIVIAYFYTWLYKRTSGNLWMMIYLHAIANTASALVPYWQNDIGRYIGLGVLILAGGLVYWFERNSALSDSRES